MKRTSVRDNGDMVSDPSLHLGANRAPRPAASALTKTGGFLAGFTHTLQPYIGCAFGCIYCYVQGLCVHRCHRPAVAWGEYVHPRTGIDQVLRRELARHAARGTLERLAVFMSSATDPYQGAELRWRLSRACLEAMGDHTPGLLVVQTRSPLVAQDFERLKRLGRRVWLSFTLETDLDDVRRTLTPRCPSIKQRLTTLAQAREAGLQVQITVSPCLPFSNVEHFARLLTALGQRVVVDTYTSGDGQSGKRTARTATPEAYAPAGWGDWRSENSARDLYDRLQALMGAAAGWSQAGFARPALELAG